MNYSRLENTNDQAIACTPFGVKYLCLNNRDLPIAFKILIIYI
ncbi:hypothetical protein SPPR111872_03220 [Sphingobacterium prati]